MLILSEHEYIATRKLTSLSIIPHLGYTQLQVAVCSSKELDLKESVLRYLELEGVM